MFGCARNRGLKAIGRWSTEVNEPRHNRFVWARRVLVEVANVVVPFFLARVLVPGPCRERVWGISEICVYRVYSVYSV